MCELKIPQVVFELCVCVCTVLVSTATVCLCDLPAVLTAAVCDGGFVLLF